MKIFLPYHPPFNFQGLLSTYENHRMGDLECFENGRMHRIVSFKGMMAQIVISHDPKNSLVIVDIDNPDALMVENITSRVRSLLDLDCDPLVVARVLNSDPLIREINIENPGIRLPSGWDPFEIAISAILGQLVSVKRGQALVSDLMEMVGDETGLFIQGRSIKFFPRPEQIISADLSSLKTTRIRKQTLIDFSRSVFDGEISLEPTQDPEGFMKKVQEIKGIGPWTAHYMAIKVLRSTDIFPKTDLILARSLELHPVKVIEGMSPWRSYVAALFWQKYASLLTRS